jgi:DNA-binding IclR family transcriptional regulator
MGKTFLAYLPEVARGAVLGSLELKEYTPRTITAPAQLAAALAEIAGRGYAVDNEEYALGVRCIAAPIFDHRNHVVAGVSVTALATRLPPERDRAVATALMRACNEISQALGFQGFEPHDGARSPVVETVG